MSFLEIDCDLLEDGFEFIDVNRVDELIFRVDPMEVIDFEDIEEWEDFELSWRCIDDE